MCNYPRQGDTDTSIVRNDIEFPYKIIIKQGNKYWLHTDPEKYPDQHPIVGQNLSVNVNGVNYQGKILRYDLEAPFQSIVEVNNHYLIKGEYK